MERVKRMTDGITTRDDYISPFYDRGNRKIHRQKLDFFF